MGLLEHYLLVTVYVVYLFCRPVWLEFPRDKNTYEMEDQFMVGRNLMVKPVTEQYVTTAQLYLPGSSSVSLSYLTV